MDSDRWHRVEALFHEALALPPEQREAFLAASCGADARLGAEVRSLLDSDDVGFGMLEATAASPAVALEILAAGDLGGGDVRDDDLCGTELGPWKIVRPIGEGGMGAVYLGERADGAYTQEVAVKVIRPGFGGPAILQRFLAERRVLARLEHPSIARLMDAGSTAAGRPYLVMEYVRGLPLDRYVDTHQLGIAARLRLFASVCDAVDHAHRRLVVHRDLKPSNILVDEDGQPRLLDFGIAKALDESQGAEVDLTQPGERVLTPRYASPEQVKEEAVTAASDVYSLGVLLYELLAGTPVYGAEVTTRAAMERAITDRDPRLPSAAARDVGDAVAAYRGERPSSLSRKLRGDLDNIVIHALAKRPEDRYRSAEAMADDVRRHLSARPVLARGGGALYPITRWIMRHQALSALMVLTLAALGALAAVWVRSTIRDGRQVAAFERLFDQRIVEDLREELDTLWPISPTIVPALEQWVSRAEALLSRGALHRETLQRSAELDLGPAGDRWMREQLARLMDDLSALAGEDVHGPTLAAAKTRLRSSSTIHARSIDEHADAWRSATTDVAADPRFGGWTLTPQLGLIPLGADPHSGLQEFAVLETGLVPTRDGAGRLEQGGYDALVMVLVPGGVVLVGAQASDPDGVHYDPEAQPDEAPPNEVMLDPFFIAKHEMTQAQWRTLCGAVPSYYKPGSRFGVGEGERVVTTSNPVEQVSHRMCQQILRRVGLVLPTEAQWETAARGGMQTPRFTGIARETLAGFANLADRHARENGGAASWSYEDWIDDGYTIHAPVGSFGPNPFGLHDVLGNVWELCQDWQQPYTVQTSGAAAERQREQDFRNVVARGGGFFNPASSLRSALRYYVEPDAITRSLGVRPARPLDP